MDAILLSESPVVLVGLEMLLHEAIGENGYMDSDGWVEVPTALLIVAIAKRAADNDVWFPRGKSATIQAITGRIDAELDLSCFGQRAK